MIVIERSYYHKNKKDRIKRKWNDKKILLDSVK